MNKTIIVFLAFIFSPFCISTSWSTENGQIKEHQKSAQTIPNHEPKAYLLGDLDSLESGASLDDVIKKFGEPIGKEEIKNGIFRLTYKLCSACENDSWLYFKDNKLIRVANSLDECTELKVLYSLNEVSRTELDEGCFLVEQKNMMKSQHELQLRQQQAQQIYQMQQLEYQRQQQLSQTLQHIDDRNRQIRLDDERRTQQAIDNARAISTIHTPLIQQSRQTDYTCLNSCTSRGFGYGYCQSACSY